MAWLTTVLVNFSIPAAGHFQALSKNDHPFLKEPNRDYLVADAGLFGAAEFPAAVPAAAVTAAKVAARI